MQPAVLPTGFASMRRLRHMTDLSSIRQELAKSRRDVLDLSLRNPLLNFLPSKRRGLEVVDERSHELFRILVGGGPAPEGASSRSPRVMYFLPSSGETAPVATGEQATDDIDDIPSELLAMLGEADDDPDEAAAPHTDNKLQTALARASLNLRLRNTFRQARLSIEEQGVNILYLALGMLTWYESESSSTERRAPLILIPVQLARSGVRENFKLRWTGDDIEANLSLEVKLKQEFGVRLPEMPAEEDLDVEDYLSRVEKAVGQRDRWAVDRNEVHLNFFSFSKLLIYKDLAAETWPEGSQPADHPLVQQLFGSDGFVQGPPDIGEDEHIDDAEGVAGLHPVVDADSSQTLAVLDAINGRNLVIQGPPGTGKSQTITNLIGEALACGRTILFVAEKMAALEVVKRRLDTVHLGDACLELHSHKTNKRVVLDELKRTLAMGRPKVERGTEDGVLLEEARGRLNDYARAVNSPVGQSGLTPHDLVGRLAQLTEDGLAVDGPGLPIRDSVSWSDEQFIRRREVAREFQELVRAIGVPCRHVWWPCGRLHFVPTDEHSVRHVLEGVSGAVLRLGRETEELIGRLGRDRAFGQLKPEDLERTIRTARRALEAPVLGSADHRNPDWVAEAARIEEVAEAAGSFAEIRSRHDAVLIPEAWDENVLAERQALRAYGDKWWRFLSGPFRAARRRLAGQLHRDEAAELVGDEVHDLLDRLYGRSGGPLSGHSSDPSSPDPSDHSPHPSSPHPSDHSPAPSSSHDPADAAELRAAADACERAMEALTEALDALAGAMELRPERLEPGEALKERAYGGLDAWLRTARDRIPSLHDVVRFNQLEKHATEMAIPEVAGAAASRPDAARQLTGLFEHACYAAWLDSAFREQEALARFDGATHGGLIDRFRELDMAQFHRNRAVIAERHWQQLPRHHGGGQLGVLRREFQKKTRHLPVRRLMQEAGRAIQTVKPVFMMSPLSIAKYIPPGSVDFDLVVFDEASQVRPVEALGAIIRGRQAVVVGDSKQLPPTSFFDRMADGGEEEASRTADLESILGMFCAQGARERMLRWHYRSRHESLIAVSNHEFYDNRLVVFPSPDAGKVDTGLVFHHNPEASYQRRGINTAEAKTVALAVMKHAREVPELTLGVAAFSNVQARRIEDEVDILRRRDPSREEFFASHPEEPFFVKNLEKRPGRRTRRDPDQHRLRQDRRRLSADELRTAQSGRRRATSECAHHPGPPALHRVLQLRLGGSGPEALRGQGRSGTQDLPGVRATRSDRRSQGQRQGGRFSVRGSGRRQAAGPGTRCRPSSRIGRVLHRPGGGGSSAARTISPGHRMRRSRLSQLPVRPGSGPAEATGAGGTGVDDPPHLEHRLVPQSATGTRTGRNGGPLREDERGATVRAKALTLKAPRESA